MSHLLALAGWWLVLALVAVLLVAGAALLVGTWRQQFGGFGSITKANRRKR